MTEIGTMTRGERREITLTVRDEDGALVNLDNRDLVMTGKWSKSAEDSAKLFQLISGNGIVHDADQSGAGKGLATATLLPEYTADLDIPTSGRWLYLDAWVADVPNQGGEYRIFVNFPVTRALP
jgi:hypothetical protein